MKLVPKDFPVPEKLEHPKFIFRKLCARDVYLDYLAVMSSIDIIRKTRGGSWPTKELTFEDDLIDLCWHQKEFENKSSFAYTIMNLAKTECLGCLYLYPPRTRDNIQEEVDVDVSFWVTQKAYDEGLYFEVYKTLKDWLETKWLFKSIHWTNKETPLQKDSGLRPE